MRVKAYPEMIRRMNFAARYVKPRRIESLGIPGAYIASAVVVENPLVKGTDAMAAIGAWGIVADASLYKREEILKKKGRGREGVRESDAALILEAYLKWGEECLQYLYGDFAFVIFNRETGEVFCGRDPLGVRPLFYSTMDQGFIFASELRYLVAAFPHEPLIRQEYLLDTLITTKTEKGEGPYENTFRLKPGHFLLRRLHFESALLVWISAGQSG
jgi:asparagine synthetase B (glutamine-hydrolysing)